MVDIKLIVEDPKKFQEICEQKNANVDIAALVENYQLVQQLKTDLQEIQAESNKVSEEIKMSVGKGGRPDSVLIEKGKEIKSKAQEIEGKLAEIEPNYYTELRKVPNMPSADTPIGPDEESNVVLESWGAPKGAKDFGFKPLEHWELGEKLGLIDSERAVKISGSRFFFLKGDLALLQFALINFTFARLTDESYIKKVIEKRGLKTSSKPFTPVIPPVLIKPEPFERMARLEPREQRYHIPGDDLYLIGSAEHTLGAMYIDETLPSSALPVRMLGYSTSFRREAGTYGKDMKGILRVHQFDKVEMECFTRPEDSLEEQNLLVALQREMVEELEIPYRVIICSTGDQGDPDARHLDLECWLPGQDKYRETHSADLMTDYQTRRMNTRFKDEKTGEKGLLHTNDATAFAIGRTIIAIMENYQQADGTIKVPKALVQYMGKDVIKG